MTVPPDRKPNKSRRPDIVTALLGFALLLPITGRAAGVTDSLRFRVYLDRDPVGEHRFQVSPDRDGRQVLSRASFDVKLFTFNAYRYRHESRERWRAGCLEQIRATTDDNGQVYEVEGEQERNALTLQVNGDRKSLPHCISTFAYWDRDFLKERRLLNPQTGELIEVRVEAVGTERYMLADRAVEAERYRLRADKLDISLWYTPDGRWIGLESDTGKGRTLRYERF